MSAFGRTANKLSKPTPPERGSFPLDHEGQCKAIMQTYLTCIKRSKGTNTDECRLLAKDYLTCRMDHNLMAPDEMANLGFTKQEEKKAEDPP